MKMRSLILIPAGLLFAGTLFAQEAKVVSPGIALTTPAADSVKAAVLDYTDGFYSGDASRMERAVHPDLNKAYPRYLARTGRTAPAYTTYSMLIEITRAGTGKLADSARHLKAEVVTIDGNFANAKVISANFSDYLQLARINGEWKIINVLWNGGPPNLVRLNGFKEEAERDRVEKAALNYIQGFASADVARLKETLDPEFTRASLIPVQQTGRTMVQRQRFESLLENAYAGTGKQEEAARDNRAEVIGMMDGLALAKVTTATSVEYLQMYWDGVSWKALNSIFFQRPDIVLEELLPAVSGYPMPGFSLPVYGGGEYTLSQHRGKNILLIFPRGWLGRSWCSICPYQYLELAELERTEQIRKKYNLEIVFVLPYDMKMVADWFATMPETIKIFDQVRHPAATAPDLTKAYAAWIQQHFPMKFDVKKEMPPTTFPVLADADRKLSKRLKIFTGYWDGVTADQNISAMFIIDKEGTLRWKYISQMTEDRPPVGQVLDVIRGLK